MCLLAVACNRAAETQSGATQTEVASDPKAKLSFTMRNSEIRHDIITALTQQGIQHWINQDGSVGFFAADSEAVDAIGFNAIGAYAARN
jgi:hypothetical protein